MTIAIDTSALAAIVFGEETADAMAGALIRHLGDIQLSAATLMECEIVIEARQGAAAVTDLHRLLTQIGVTVVPFDDVQSRLAILAWQRFGKGRHPAALNLGDCYSYALAKSLGAPLLYTGNDFNQTDIASAL